MDDRRAARCHTFARMRAAAIVAFPREWVSRTKLAAEKFANALASRRVEGRLRSVFVMSCTCARCVRRSDCRLAARARLASLVHEPAWSLDHLIVLALKHRRVFPKIPPPTVRIPPHFRTHPTPDNSQAYPLRLSDSNKDKRPLLSQAGGL